ncbi:MBL fold metallo-hydrolase [Bacillaceae bacterium S4-13-58]
MEIKQYSLGSLGTNAYILFEGKEALIIDPGGESAEIVSFLKENELNPIAILLTHAHFDHIGGIDFFRNHFQQLPVYLHEEEKEWLQDSSLNGSKWFGLGDITTQRGPDFLMHEDKYKIGNFQFQVLHTPGHSPGSVSFVFEEATMIIGGDLLFQGGIGRTDLPGGDFDQLLKSIKEKIFLYPDPFDIYPGHGPKTSVWFEKSTNPFIPD